MKNDNFKPGDNKGVLAMSDSTLYERVMSWNDSNAQRVSLAYSRIPDYCIKAARTIDEFEKAFEKEFEKDS